MSPTLCWSWHTRGDYEALSGVIPSNHFFLRREIRAEWKEWRAKGRQQHGFLQGDKGSLKPGIYSQFHSGKQQIWLLLCLFTILGIRLLAFKIKHSYWYQLWCQWISLQDVAVISVKDPILTSGEPKKSFSLTGILIWRRWEKVGLDGKVSCLSNCNTTTCVEEVALSARITLGARGRRGKKSCLPEVKWFRFKAKSCYKTRLNPPSL